MTNNMHTKFLPTRSANANCLFLRGKNENKKKWRKRACANSLSLSFVVADCLQNFVRHDVLNYIWRFLHHVLGTYICFNKIS